MRRPLAVYAACCILAIACAVGCTSHVEDDAVRTPGGSVQTDSGELPLPSLTREPSGRAAAVGTLVYRRDQGGFFALTDLTPAEPPTTTARVVVVLVQPDGSRQAPDLAPLVGAYCSFTGSLRAETSASALPELSFDSYRILSDVPVP